MRSPVVPENAGSARASSDGGGTVTPGAVRAVTVPLLTGVPDRAGRRATSAGATWRPHSRTSR